MRGRSTYAGNVIIRRPQKVISIKHQQAIHEGKKYPYRGCNHQATIKGSLSKHQRAIHGGKKYPCRKCDHQQLQRVVSVNTSEQYMNMNAVIREPE
jgi:hypothetical protein